jgi:hypothetical protein
VSPPVPAEQSSTRFRYLDLLRIASIGLVVIGHWLLVDVTVVNGQLSGVDSLDYITWGGWVTLLFQVLPVFFLVGGFVNAQSWTAHRASGEAWDEWVQTRAMRLLWPTAVYVLVISALVVVVGTTGIGPDEIAQGAWVVAVQLWFLPVYLMLIALTPLLFRAHRRWGFAVPIAMALGAVVVDFGVIAMHWEVLGYLNYLFVWGSMHQWGFAWRDGSLSHPLRRPYVFALAGAAAVAALVALGPFPIDMVGTGEHAGNTSPPSIALLAFAAVQAGIALAAAPAATRLLARPRVWRGVARLNPAVMTVYLWHMVPVVIVGLILSGVGAVPHLGVGSWQWWLSRPVWFLVLAAILLPLTIAVQWMERPLVRLPIGLGPRGGWSPILMVIGITASGVSLARLAVVGFAFNGKLTSGALLLFVCGVALVVMSGASSRHSVGAV